jgi:hypothetical protein
MSQSQQNLKENMLDCLLRQPRTVPEYLSDELEKLFLFVLIAVVSSQYFPQLLDLSFFQSRVMLGCEHQDIQALIRNGTVDSVLAENDKDGIIKVAVCGKIGNELAFDGLF